MRNRFGALIIGVLLAGSLRAVAQHEPELKNIPDSVNLVWKDVERNFVALAEAMPEDKWNFEPTQGDFKDVRTFGEQVKHVACGNEAWAKKMTGEKTPERCDLGGPNPAKSKAEILAYLRDSFNNSDPLVREGGVNFVSMSASARLRSWKSHGTCPKARSLTFAKKLHPFRPYIRSLHPCSAMDGPRT